MFGQIFGIVPSRRFFQAALAAIAASLSATAMARAQDFPSWLAPYVGHGPGQIAPVVLERAREFYFAKVNSGAVRNGCYFAMDATRPSENSAGALLPRFYVICEGQRVFRALSSGHGGGRDLGGVNVSNGRQCAKNFGNAQDSKLTTGGPYLTGEVRTSFKGYFRGENGRLSPFLRAFVPFDGEGAAANARDREIGGHAAELLRASCRMKAPASPYADGEGFVPYGKLVDYAGGRSNGCTSWSSADADQIVDLIRDNRTTLYIYPEARDVVARAGGRADVYWDAFCLKKIGAPKFWSQTALGPAIEAFKRAHPPATPRPLPICGG